MPPIDPMPIIILILWLFALVFGSLLLCLLIAGAYNARRDK